MSGAIPVRTAWMRWPSIQMLELSTYTYKVMILPFGLVQLGRSRWVIEASRSRRCRRVVCCSRCGPFNGRPFPLALDLAQHVAEFGVRPRVGVNDRVDELSEHAARVVEAHGVTSSGLAQPGVDLNSLGDQGRR